MHLILDTSGSMSCELGRVLGAIASFCEGAGVGEVHILQCDTQVTVDEFVPIECLETYRISGLGGSDLTPAIELLAEDPEVAGIVVITDGMIDYPQNEPACRVLWVVSGDGYFSPRYGDVLSLNKNVRTQFHSGFWYHNS